MVLTCSFVIWPDTENKTYLLHHYLMISVIAIFECHENLDGTLAKYGEAMMDAKNWPKSKLILGTVSFQPISINFTTPLPPRQKSGTYQAL